MLNTLTIDIHTVAQLAILDKHDYKTYQYQIY